MRLSLRRDDGVVVVSVSGSVGEEDYEALARELEGLKSTDSPRVVLDLGGVEELGDQVVERLAAKRSEFQALGGDIKLIRAARVLNTLRLYGFCRFEVYPSRWSALKSFQLRDGVSSAGDG